MSDNFYYKSPIGVLEIVIENKIIRALRVVNGYPECSNAIGYFSEVARQLDEYFEGIRVHFDLEISPDGTEFQRRVWDELVKIPYGETKSYKEIAELIGLPNAQRAIGSACNKNPILLIIPCHRVIAKTGKLTGFVGGLDAKMTLLKLEKTLF